MSVSFKAKCLEITKSVLKSTNQEKPFIGEKITFQPIENKTGSGEGITSAIGNASFVLVFWDENLFGKYELQKEYTITIS